MNTRKTICFANAGPGRKLIAEILCAAEFGLTLVNSFKLVGGVITASGKSEIETRARRDVFKRQATDSNGVAMHPCLSARRST